MGARSWITGVILAALAAVVSNLGLNLQKLTHIRQAQQRQRTKLHASNAGAAATAAATTADEDDDDDDDSGVAVAPEYAREPLWLVGLALIILGSIADFVALGFGAQSTIAPLGSLTLVANVYFAPLILDEELTRRDMLATIAIILGSVLSVAFASHDDTMYSIDDLFSFYLTYRFAMYAFAVTGSLAAMWWLLQVCEELLRHDNMHEYRQFEKYHRFCYSALAGTVGAQSVLFAKCTAELLVSTMSGEAFMFAYMQTYIILAGLGASIFFQLKWLNEGLARFDALYVVPVFQSFWILVSVGGGLIFFGEYRQMSAASTLFFPLGICITITGVYILSKRSVSGRRAPNKTYDRLYDSNIDDDDDGGGDGNELVDVNVIGAGGDDGDADGDDDGSDGGGGGGGDMGRSMSSSSPMKMKKKTKKTAPSPRHIDHRIGYGGSAAPATFTPSMMGRVSHVYSDSEDHGDDNGGGGGGGRQTRLRSMESLVLE